MKAISAFVFILLVCMASATAISAVAFPSVHVKRSKNSCPAKGDNRDCAFYREAAEIASESLQLAAYGTENVGAEKAQELEQRLCKLVDDYGLPRPELCEADRMMLESVERINWPKFIYHICRAIGALFE